MKLTGKYEENISFTEEEAVSGEIVFHCGDLELRSLTAADSLTLPQSVGGKIYLRSLPDEQKGRSRREKPRLSLSIV